MDIDIYSAGHYETPYKGEICVNGRPSGIEERPRKNETGEQFALRLLNRRACQRNNGPDAVYSALIYCYGGKRFRYELNFRGNRFHCLDA